MDKDRKEYYKKRLEEEKNILEDTIEKMNNKAKLGSMEEYYSELSFYDNHPADLGTETFMMEQDKGFKQKIESTILEIESAIQKIDDGTFGLCEKCKNRIGEERLDLIPYVKLCINCAKEKIPLDTKMKFRPEEENIILPFVRSKEEIQFDREDSYQEVAKFNKIEKDPSFSTGDNQGIFDEREAGIVEEIEKISKDEYDDTL